jgi:hypothetical protein
MSDEKFVFDVAGPVIEWRGPAPFFFLPLDDEAATAIRALSPSLTYGWGVIPVEATIGGTTFTTSLIPRENTYFLPLKVAVRRAEGIDIDTSVRATLSF